MNLKNQAMGIVDSQDFCPSAATCCGGAASLGRWLFRSMAAMALLATACSYSVHAQNLAIEPAERIEHTGRLEIVPAESVGFDSRQLVKISQLADAGIAAGKMPGCVICVGRRGKIAYLHAFGNKRLEPQVEAMTTDTVFDLASLTKPIATATSIMQLVEDGSLRLSAKVTDYLPEFAPHGKDAITVEQLLLHQSGLIPDNDLEDYQSGPEVAWQRICELELAYPVGNLFKYSDVNFIVLGELVRRTSGARLDEYTRRQIFEPLGLEATGFLPNADLRARAAPTGRRDEAWIQGAVHDPRSHALGGVAGHAGLFSTAEDLAVYAQSLLNGGAWMSADGQAVQIIAPPSLATMIRDYPVSSGLRGLGWDKRSPYSSNRGDLLSDSAFGHGGFTGTVLWIDPELELFFIFLSNRLHPDGSGSVNQLSGQIANVIAGSIRAE